MPAQSGAHFTVSARVLCWSCLAWIVLATSSAALLARQNRAGLSTSTSGTRVVSPSVLATWIAKREKGGSPKLDLLVLWRGAPAWFATRGPGERTPGGGSGTFSITLMRGGRQLQLEFDSRKRIAHVGDTEVRLEDKNVILVDEVDVPNGGKILGVYRVDPKLIEASRIEPILRSSPALIEYLRCDAPVDNAADSAALANVCAMILAK